MKHIWASLCLSVCLLILACAHRESSALTTPFDGTWQNSSLGYDLELLGPVGVAVTARGRSMRDGDPVFRMISSEGGSFTGRLWMDDGAWHTVTGEKMSDGTLEVKEGNKTWILKPVKQ
jgi:hypothetical protein